MVGIRNLMLGVILLISIASCTNVQRSATNLGIHPAHPLSSIIQGASVIKIDTGIILNNKNLQPFINDLRESSLVLSYKTDSVPGFIRSFLEQLSGDHFTIANPGQNWNCCDGSWDESLPNRSLICVGGDKSLFLISYKTGGIGVEGHIVLIRYLNDKVTDLWSGTMLEYLNNKTAIVSYLIKNKDKVWGLNTNIIRI